jgi:hypothetical protein
MAVTQLKHKPEPSLEYRNFSKPEETRSFKLGKLDLVTLGGVTFGRAIFQPGWRWSTHVKPIAKTQSCEAQHLSLQISGRLHVVMDDGTEREFGPGEVASILPGHDAWVVGNEPVVVIDISGMENYAKKRVSNSPMLRALPRLGGV